MSELTLSVSPHIRSPRSTQKIMLDMIIALMPALVMSVVYFGMRSLLLTAVSVAVCVLTEYVWEKLAKTPVTVGDLSAAVTGILLAFNVPAGMAVWKLAVGDIAAICVVKMLFGGIGRNFVNPALVGRVVLAFSFPTDMMTYSFPKKTIDILAGATPLAVMDKLDWSDALELFIGRHGGVLGCTCSAALIAGGVYLVIRKVIKPTIPLTYIGSYILFMWLFGGSAPVLSTLGGGLMLGAIFMATDYTTSPFTNKGKLIFGIGCGFITAAIRAFANATEGVSFAILLMNLLVPYINSLTMNKPLGGMRAK